MDLLLKLLCVVHLLDLRLNDKRLLLLRTFLGKTGPQQVGGRSDCCLLPRGLAFVVYYRSNVAHQERGLAVVQPCQHPAEDVASHDRIG
jgi:hypothetical protein